MIEGLLEKLDAYEVHHVPWTENKEANVLSKLTGGGMPEHIAQMCRMEEVERPNAEALSICNVVVDQSPAAPTWIDTLKEYIHTGHLPADEKEAMKVRR